MIAREGNSTRAFLGVSASILGTQRTRVRDLNSDMELDIVWSIVYCKILHVCYAE